MIEKKTYAVYEDHPKQVIEKVEQLQRYLNENIAEIKELALQGAWISTELYGSSETDYSCANLLGCTEKHSPNVNDPVYFIASQTDAVVATVGSGPSGPIFTVKYATSRRGEKGDTGATGEQGPKGDTGAPGEQGPKGDTGATGPAPTLDSEVIVTEVANSDPVSGEFIQTSTGYQLSLGLHKGAPGDKGEPGEQGPRGLTGTGISTIVASFGYVSGERTITPIEVTLTDGTYQRFSVSAKNGQPGTVPTVYNHMITIKPNTPAIDSGKTLATFMFQSYDNTLCNTVKTLCEVIQRTYDRASSFPATGAYGLSVGARATLFSIEIPKQGVMITPRYIAPKGMFATNGEAIIETSDYLIFDSVSSAIPPPPPVAPIAF